MSHITLNPSILYRVKVTSKKQEKHCPRPHHTSARHF